jgi:hypothetical protein
MNPLGLGQFMSDRAALDRHKSPPQPLHRPCARRQPRPTPRLTAALVQRYPEHGMLIAAQIGAKVAKGEMKWG